MMNVVPAEFHDAGAGATTSAPHHLSGGDWLSVQALSWVFDFSEATHSARHVLLSIANHAKADGTGAWPSYETIAHEAKIHRSTVSVALGELKELKELSIDVGAGPHGCNLYSISKMKVVGKSDQSESTDPVVGIDDKTSRNLRPEPSLAVKEPSLESKATAFEPEVQNQECEKCGSTEGVTHKCPGYLSAKQRAKRAGVVERKPFPKRRPFQPFEMERKPSYVTKYPPRSAPAPTEPVTVDEDYPKL